MKNILAIVFFGLIVNVTNYFMKPAEPIANQNLILNPKIVELEKQKAVLMEEVRVISKENAAELRKIKQNKK